MTAAATYCDRCDIPTDDGRALCWACAGEDCPDCGGEGMVDVGDGPYSNIVPCDCAAGRAIDRERDGEGPDERHDDSHSDCNTEIEWEAPV